MKQLKIIFMLIFVLLLGSCVGNIGGYYKINYSGDTEIILNKAPKMKKENTEVVLILSVVTDVDTLVFVNDQKISYETIKYDGHNCKQYKFQMPSKNVDVVITHDSFYNVETTTFQNVFYWTNYLLRQDIQKVSIKTNSEKVDSIDEIVYSEQENELDAFYEIFSKEIVYLKDFKYSNEKRVEYSFYDRDGHYNTIVFYDKIICYRTFSQNYYFKFKDETYSLPKIESDNKHYSFRLDYRNGNIQVYTMENKEKLYDFYSIYIFIFKESDMDLKEQKAKYYINFNQEKIYVYDAKTFTYKEKIYQVISEEDFLSLFT